MLKKLTNGQFELLHQCRDYWQAVGFSTEECDFEQARTFSNLIYKRCGAKPPGTYYILDSPADPRNGQLGREYISGWDKHESRKSLLRSFYKVLGLTHMINDNRVSENVRWVIDDEIGTIVWQQAGIHVQRASKTDSKHNYSQYESRRMCIEEFLHNAQANHKSNHGLQEFKSLISVIGGWTPYEDICIFHRRPKYIKRDNQGLLHCETGSAIRYADGFRIYAWRGVNIPGQWLAPGGMTAQKALSQRNIERRRTAAEIIGWDKVLEQLDGSLINRNRDPQIGKLVEVNMPQTGRERFLIVKCGTGRTFALPVPLWMQTAHEANAWTYGLSTFDYEPEVRT